MSEQDVSGSTQAADFENITPSSVFLPRLAAGPDNDLHLPKLNDLGLDWIRIEAWEWQGLRQWADWWEMHAMHDASQERRWAELCWLFGSTAEVVLLCLSASVEVELLRRAVETNKLPTIYGMSRRWFGEKTADSVISAGDKLANTVLRMLLLEDVTLATAAFTGKAFIPFTDDKRNWISIRDASKLSAACGSSAAGFGTAAEVVLTLWQSDDWRRLTKLRDIDYHRGRRETAGVTGVAPDNTLWDRMKRDGQVGFGREMLPTYTFADGYTDEVCDVATKSLKALGAAMAEVRGVWDASAGNVVRRPRRAGQ